MSEAHFPSVIASMRPAAWRINDAAFQLGVSRVTVYKLISEKKLAVVKIAGRSVIPDSEIVRITTPPTATEGA